MNVSATIPGRLSNRSVRRARASIALRLYTVGKGRPRLKSGTKPGYRRRTRVVSCLWGWERRGEHLHARRLAEGEALQ